MPELITPAVTISSTLGNMALKFEFTDTEQNRNTLSSKIKWTLKGYGTGNTTTQKPYIYAKNIKLSIDGSSNSYWATSNKLHNGDIVASGTTTVYRNASGYKDISVKISGNLAGYTKEATATFTLSRIEPYTKPPIISNLTATPKNKNATVSGWNIFLQGYSSANATATVTAQNGTITNKVFLVDGKSANSIITRSGSLQLKCIATDSYNNSAEATSTITVEPYSNPVITEWNAVRCDSNGNADTKGKYIKLKCIGGISSCGGHNAITVSAVIKNDTTGATNTATLQSGVESIVGGEYSSTTKYTVTFNVSDSLQNKTSADVSIPVEDVGLNFCRVNGRSGAAMFDYATESGVFKVNGIISLPASKDNQYAKQRSFITHSGFIPDIGYIRRYDNGTIEIWGYKVYDDLNVMGTSIYYTAAQDIPFTAWDTSVCPAPVHPVSVFLTTGKSPNGGQGISYVGTTANISTVAASGISFVIGSPGNYNVSVTVYYKAIYLDYEP